VADEKKYFREILREGRAALSKARAAALSVEVQVRLLHADCYRNAAAVVLYAAKDNEVETEVIFTDALASGRRVFFPRVVLEYHQLSLVRVNHRAEFRRGAFDLREPTGAAIVPVKELGPALICVPGVAFSRAGQRLGRGGGYYDRLLAGAAPQAVAAGLAYSFQVLDRLPESPGDRRLDLIVTESAIHWAGGAPPPVKERIDQGGVPRCC
jgi:5-formyltetrahydrofolate cyclo-ligase